MAWAPKYVMSDETDDDTPRDMKEEKKRETAGALPSLPSSLFMLEVLSFFSLFFHHSSIFFFFF